MNSQLQRSVISDIVEMSLRALGESRLRGSGKPSWMRSCLSERMNKSSTGKSFAVEALCTKASKLDNTRQVLGNINSSVRPKYRAWGWAGEGSWERRGIARKEIVEVSRAHI